MKEGDERASFSFGEGEDRRGGARIPPVAQSAPCARLREALPVYGYKQELLDAIRNNQVVVIEGETGCGKTTQVPHYVVEEAAERGEPCSVVCTQPRRISAIGVASRVAEERGERCGRLCGYSIRHETCTSAETHLLFCTTGTLLRRLEIDTTLTRVTHVFIDEVHERGLESDFLLLALKDLLKKRADLKVVLMSATLDADLFSKYFDGAPAFKIPGRTFPVTTLYLEDALMMTNHFVDPRAEWCKRSGWRPPAPGANGGIVSGGYGASGRDADERDMMDRRPEEIPDWELDERQLSTRYRNMNHPPPPLRLPLPGSLLYANSLPPRGTAT